jgi:excisionase family DNA binding protein
MTEQIHWLSTKEASERLGITLRSLYRFIDEGDLVAYKFGRVIRIQESDVSSFIEASRISPGSLEHLYPEVKGSNGNGNGNGRPHIHTDGVGAAEAG